MTQLKDLILDCWRFVPIVNPDHVFTKLFNNMKQLEEIEIGFPYGMDGTVDAAIDRLVDNNPRLTHISLARASVTGASLVSLSRLTAVQRLYLWHGSIHAPEFTTDDILTLLRGGSRHVLQSVKAHMRSRPDQGRIEAELKIMEKEIGCTFSLIVDSQTTLSWLVIRRKDDDD